MSKPVLWIISGPSSVGKSTFLSSERCRQITGLSSTAPTFFAFERSLAGFGDEDAFFHYNLLRPIARFQKRQRSSRWHKLTARFQRFLSRSRPSSAGLQKRAEDFRSDPAWTHLITSGFRLRALVLVADRATIIDRARVRTQVEDQKLSGKALIYQANDWLSCYEWLDLDRLYRAWYAELTRAGIEFLIIDSNTPDFRVCKQQ